MKQVSYDRLSRDVFNQAGGPKDPKTGNRSYKKVINNMAARLIEDQNIKRNKRSVWEVSTHPFPGAHFATFPPKLIEPCIRAGTSSKGCCSKCGTPWIRTSKKTNAKTYEYLKVGIPNEGEQRGRRKGQMGNSQYESIGWEPSCNCKSKVIPCTVLDPFGGSGTTGMVCSKLERDAILIEISPKYAEMTRRRVGQRFAEIWDVEND